MKDNTLLIHLAVWLIAKKDYWIKYKLQNKIKHHRPKINLYKILMQKLHHVINSKHGVSSEKSSVQTNKQKTA